MKHKANLHTNATQSNHKHKAKHNETQSKPYTHMQHKAIINETQSKHKHK